MNIIISYKDYNALCQLAAGTICVVERLYYNDVKTTEYDEDAIINHPEELVAEVNELKKNISKDVMNDINLRIYDNI